MDDGADDRVRHVRGLIERSIALKVEIGHRHIPAILAIADLCIAALKSGRKLLLCGNGGSAADAQHLAAELLVRLRASVERAPLPALALALDPSSITACGNDYSFEVYYERMLRALAQPGDVLIAISTSGRSPNLVRALRAAREMSVKRVGLLGGDGGAAAAECELALVVPSTETGRIQESHITIGHAVMELIENAVCGNPAPSA
ncbi:MAG: D-sedoheptulose-7-phosphate isomerase [Stellaceae bacterium]